MILDCPKDIRSTVLGLTGNVLDQSVPMRKYQFNFCSVLMFKIGDIMNSNFWIAGSVHT